VNRSNIILLVLILVVVSFLVYASRQVKDGSERSKWRFEYQYDGEKKAYDRDFFINYLKKDVGSSNFTKLDERFSRNDDLEENGLYFFFNRDFDIDKTETKALYDYVVKGNSALIIANDFNFELFKEIRGIQIDQSDQYLVLSTYDSAIRVTDTIQYSDKKTVPVSVISYGGNPIFTSFDIDTSDIDNDIYSDATIYDWEDDNDYVYEDEEYVYEEDEYSYEEDEYTYEDEEPKNVLEETILEVETKYPKSEISSIGTSHSQGSNILEIKLGEGTIYLHSTPIVFTNAQFDKPEIFNYVESVFNDIEYDHIYWDELAFQFLNAENEGYGLSDKSYFEYIFNNKALKMAFYFFLVGLMVFLIVGIKRKYNAIQIVDPLTNSSIDFSKTIARLYWLNPNHRKMADQKMKMFLFEVRNRYGLTTYVLDDEFKLKFKSKSGVSEKHINRLFDAYNLARHSNSIHEDVLKQISETIVVIKQQWK
jgi:hypothetical protein